MGHPITPSTPRSAAVSHPSSTAGTERTALSAAVRPTPPLAHADLFEQPVGQGPRPRGPTGPVTERSPIAPHGQYEWNGGDILRHLGQLGGSGTGADAHATERCAASCELANAIANGAPATDRFVLQLYRANDAHPERQQELAQIYQRLGGDRATFGDLHRLQELTYQTYEQDGRPGFSPTETQAMRDQQTQAARRDAPADAVPGRFELHQHGTGEVPEMTQRRIDSLRAGESFMLNVDAGGDDIRHAVTVGRDRDGHTYLYDPAPRDGDPTYQLAGERPALWNSYLDGSRGNGAMNIIVGSETQRDWPPR